MMTMIESVNTRNIDSGRLEVETENGNTLVLPIAVVMAWLQLADHPPLRYTLEYSSGYYGVDEYGLWSADFSDNPSDDTERLINYLGQYAMVGA